MKLRCERDQLVEALSSAQRAVSTRSSALRALSGLHLEVLEDQLTVVGTDLELTITRSIQVGNTTNGVAVVPAKLLVDIVRSLEGAVTLETKADKLQITGGRSQFAISMMASEDFPKLSRTTTATFMMDAKQLGESLRQVTRAASNDDARPVLTGVLLTAEESGLRMVATDSYRLALRDLPTVKILETGQKVLIPGQALRELERLIGSASEVQIEFGDKSVTFLIEGTELTTRLIDGEFPNYRQLIPASYPNKLTVDKEALINAIHRVRLLVKDSLTPVRMQMRADGVLLTVSQESGQATEDVEAKYEGEEMTVAFNPVYFADGVDAAPGDTVIIQTLDPMKPATVRGVEDEEFLYLLMPVRVA